MAGLPPLETTRSRDEDEAQRRAREREALQEGMRAGVRSIVVTGVPAVVLLPIMMYGMRSSLEAANHLFVSKDVVHWQDAFMPAVLFAMFGGAYGALAGWRLASGAGIVGRQAWLIGAAAVAGLMVIGAFMSFLIFDESLTMLWVCLVVMAVGGLGTMTYFTLYAG